MKKRLHPIRKITKRLDTAMWYACGKPTGNPEKIIARHVKPLLDALDEWGHCSVEVGEPGHELQDCSICRLLAAWKEPL